MLSPMNRRDLRFVRAGGIVLLTVMSGWAGYLMAQPSHRALGLVLFAFLIIAIAILLFAFLRDAWKPDA